MTRMNLEIAATNEMLAIACERQTILGMFSI